MPAAAPSEALESAPEAPESGDDGGVQAAGPDRVAPKEATEPIAPAPLPRDQLESIVESAGLQWVETAPHPETAPQPEEVPPPRTRRARKPRSTPNAEPLEQVETSRK
ncbi:MAG TPA: hypothetical protein VGE10_02730 [Zeimonas sp.]